MAHKVNIYYTQTSKLLFEASMNLAAPQNVNVPLIQGKGLSLEETFLRDAPLRHS